MSLPTAEPFFPLPTGSAGTERVDAALPRPTIIGVSTKMYLGYSATRTWIYAIRHAVDERPELAAANVRPFVIPSFPLLPSALNSFEGTTVVTGAQNASWQDGPVTGEVSPGLLAEMGVRIVEIGHAERRSQFGETDEVVRLKTTAVLASGITPLLCVGEPSRSTVDAAVEYVVDQVLSALEDPTQLGSLVLAYEPVWAIGAPAPAEPAYVNEVVRSLRITLSERTGVLADSVRVISGGSAGPGLLAQLPEVDGLFLGRFAHDPANFATVLDEALARNASRA